MDRTARSRPDLPLSVVGGARPSEDDPQADEQLRSRRRRVVAAGLAAAGIAVFVWAGGFGWLSDADNLEAFLAENGAVGPVAFIIVVWLTRPLGTPMPVYMIPAAAVWPAPTAILIYWIGHVGASYIAFRSARGFARAWVEPRIPPRLRRFDDRLAAGGIKPVVVVRLATRIFAVDWLLGLTNVSARHYVIGTATGVLPSIALFILASGSIIEAVGSARPEVQMAITASVVAVGTWRILANRRRPTSAPAG